jgi:hypothetical protein
MSKATGGTPIDTPASVLTVARHLPGWALGSHKAESFPDGTIRVTVHLSHRGGIVVPPRPFKALNGYHTVRVHSFVSGSGATLWLTLRQTH